MTPDVKEITVSRGETVNLGNFNSYRVDISISARIAPDDDPNDVYNQLMNWVESNLSNELESVKK